MRPVSSRWAGALASSRPYAIEARVYQNGEGTDLDLADGSVTLEAATAIRGRCSLTLNGIDWVPRDASDKLAPYTPEINLRRGVVHDDGTTETVSLGWFGIEDVDVNDDGLTTTVTGLDRANRLQLAKFEDTFRLVAGTVASEGILTLAQDAWPDVPFDPDLPGMTELALTVDRDVVAVAGDDRWEFMQGIATAIGMVLFFDSDGILTLRRYADAGRVAEVTEADENGEGGVLVSANRGWSRTNAHNRWYVTGESTDDAVYSGVATDDNPLSPTYYFGDFGKVPGWWSSPYIHSDEQAQDAADSMLAQEIGTASNVSFGMVPNPALEPEDTVLVKRERIGVNEDHILDSVTIGLSAGAEVSCTTRERLVQ